MNDDDPSARAIRQQRTALEILESPIIAPTSPPAPQPSTALEAVAQEFAERIERVRTGGAR